MVDVSECRLDEIEVVAFEFQVVLLCVLYEVLCTGYSRF